ncbi:MAG: hypothetical protein Q8O89_04015 [Nanoarchaeota archaeon]|nr:hypothetical protein [Nanoarchaeota archaeon]
MQKTKIIIDTNFIMIPIQFKVDIYSEIRELCDFPYELCVMNGTIDELKKIQKDKNQKSSDKMAAKIALSMLEKHKHSVIKSESKIVDDAIADYCKDKDCIVATQDGLLKKRLKEQNTKLIILRAKRFLKFE